VNSIESILLQGVTLFKDAINAELRRFGKIG